MSARIILASASPRRMELLGQIGVRCEQKVAAVDETPHENESPEECAVRLAVEKARAVCQQHGSAKLPVLGADTAVVIDGQLLGKPRNRQDCGLMLRRLSGRVHQVITAVALVADREEIRVSVSNVWFRPISDAEIQAYCRSSEPHDKAGSYAIQGLAAIFIERLDGSYSGVMGLPLFETAHLLEDFGIRILGHEI